MSNKASLMASLTGDLPAEPEEDLFGEIPLEEEAAPPPALTPQPMPAPAAAPAADPGQLIVDNPLDVNTNSLSMSMPVQSTQPVATPKKSLLASSGLLGNANGGGGGGLFDDVDKEEEERQRMEEQKRLEEQRRMQEEEQRRMQAEEERRRQAEEQMMQTVNLSSSVGVYPHQQQQQMMMPQMANQQMHNPQMANQQITNQMQNMSMSTPAPMSFAERSQMMQQQQVAVSQYMTPAPQMHHQQQQQARDTFSPAGFYRPDPISTPPQPLPNQPNTFVYSTTGGDVQTHSITPSMANSSMSRLPQTPTPSSTVGMHNSIGRHIRPLVIVQPQPFEPIYGHAAVSEPLLVQPPSLFNVVPPHWTYQVQTTLKEGGCWLVRRRFRHIVALEDRLREECPGAILPPR
jgi:hypothetical protein